VPRTIHAFRNQSVEWSFQSAKDYADPFNDVSLDVVITDDKGKVWKVPAFWAGGAEWRVRFAPPHPGSYNYRTLCSDVGNEGLHDVLGVLKAGEYEGDNPLLRHGFPRVADDHRHFTFQDGTPFFWLADTWWMGLCKRLSWPEDFQLLAQDRRDLGFTTIQIVAGLYPDMPPFDERGANEAGFPWAEGFSRVNPAYFDMADLRIQYLVRSGLVPCLVGCWGYFLSWMGPEKMKQHWRYLVARYASYPVFWCLAGEATMPYYLSTTKDEDRAKQKRGWTDLARYLRGLDPYGHPITIHPTRFGRDQVEDPSVLDFDMLQTGHNDRKSVPNHVKSIGKSLGRSPTMPVVVGEVCYEGILEASRSEIQRLVFWSALLSGTAGHTYGANGIWQVNTRERPFGPSPHGSSWGETPWEEAYRLPGSRHLAVGKRILERYPWWRFESHPEWVEPHFNEEDYFQPYAGGIPGEVRVIYLPDARPLHLTGLDTESGYHAFFIDPKNGKTYDIGRVPRAKEWDSPKPPIFQDWLLVLESEGSEDREDHRA